MIVSIPIKTVSETNAREHWASRHRRRAKQRGVTCLVVAAHMALSTDRVELPCVVTLTRLAPSAGLDGDNLQSSLKGIRDAVADALGVDDRDPRVTWKYAQNRSMRGKYAVEIRIEEGRHAETAA